MQETAECGSGNRVRRRSSHQIGGRLFGAGAGLVNCRLQLLEPGSSCLHATERGFQRLEIVLVHEQRFYRES